MSSICFAYEYGKESWSTPISLVKEFLRRGWKVDKVHLSNGESERLTYNYYDVILTMDWKGIDLPPNVHEAIPEYTYKIRENADTPQNYDKHLHASQFYNLLLTPDHESFIKYKSLGHSCLWFNHFADTDIHRPYPLSSYGPLQVVSTRGQGGSQFMDNLSQIMPGTFVNRNGLVGEEYGFFLANSFIVLQNSRWKEITRRIFEGMACGRLVITDRLPEKTKIDELFVEDQDIVYYDDFSDCISKINYYLWNAEAREKIAKSGYEKTIQNHTQKNRVDLIIQEYEKWKKTNK